MSGTLYGLGVGPGDPELVSIKAARLVRACPVLAYPAPEHGDSLARRIMTPHLPGGQTEIAIRMPLSVDRFPAQAVYDAAARDIAGHLAAGRDVAVLCLGDPLLWGSFIYLHERLARTHRVEIVPGIASPGASAAVLGLPLAARDDGFAILPATRSDEQLERALATVESAAVIKLGRHFARVRALLERLGLAAGARYVEHATMESQRTLALASVDPSGVPYFSLIIVRRGAAAALDAP